MTSNDSRNDLRARIARTGIGFLFLIGLVSVALFAAGCGSSSDSGSSTSGTEATAATSDKAEPADKPASAGEGKSSFASSCGGCHALKDAGTKGAAGPDLDSLKPDKARVASAIEKGGTGSGAMPKGLLTGDKADQVADYVSSTAGK